MSELDDLRTTVRVLSELLHREYGKDPIVEIVDSYAWPFPTDADLAAVRRVTATL